MAKDEGSPSRPGPIPVAHGPSFSTCLFNVTPLSINASTPTSKLPALPLRSDTGEPTTIRSPRSLSPSSSPTRPAASPTGSLPSPPKPRSADLKKGADRAPSTASDPQASKPAPTQAESVLSSGGNCHRSPQSSPKSRCFLSRAESKLTPLPTSNPCEEASNAAASRAARKPSSPTPGADPLDLQPLAKEAKEAIWRQSLAATRAAIHSSPLDDDALAAELEQGRPKTSPTASSIRSHASRGRGHARSPSARPRVSTSPPRCIPSMEGSASPLKSSVSERTTESAAKCDEEDELEESAQEHVSTELHSLKSMASASLALADGQCSKDEFADPPHHSHRSARQLPHLKHSARPASLE